MSFVPGQRWISNAEPELGLGTVVRLDGRTVQVLFATAGVLRHYAKQAAPLARAEFRVGQKVSGQKQNFVVERVSEAQRFTAALLSERVPSRESDPRAGRGSHPSVPRIITPH